MMMLVVTAISSFTTSITSAQPFNLPVTGDIQLTSLPSNGVKNTGTAQVNRLQAVVWDGDNPGLGVYNHANNQSTTILLSMDGAFDPDVVIDPVTGTRILVVYQMDTALAIDPNVYYEYFEYFPSTNTLTPVTFTQQMNFDVCFACSYPNVDVSPDGIAVAVWQDTIRNGMYAVKFQINIFGLPEGIIIPSTRDYEIIEGCYRSGELLRKPDVAVIKVPEYDNRVVSVVFEMYDFVNSLQSQILITRFEDVDISTVNSGCNIQLVDVVELSVGNVIDPRVSTIWEYAFADTGQCNVTWIHRTFGSNLLEVRSKTKSTVWQSTQAINVSGLDLRGYPNKRPVTTYYGDLILNAWDYDDLNMNLLRNTREPILRQLNYWAGTMIEPNEYSVIPFNRVPAIAHESISIDGRYLDPFVPHASMAFWQPASGQMFIKAVEASNLNLRRGTESDNDQASSDSRTLPTLVYPNPVMNELNIQGTAVLDIQLFDVTGKQVNLSLQFETHGLRTYNTAMLPKGTYVLRLQSTTGVKTYKIIK